MKKVLLIIPAYNEEENIERVVNDLIDHYPQLDYVVINDCSTDQTGQICKNRGYNYIDLPSNLGIGGGVQTGYQYALKNGYDIAIQMDGDGQHSPEYIDKLIEPIISEEADVVIGSRFIDGEGFQSTGLRRFGINFLSRLIKFCCGAMIKDVTSGFRAVNRQYIAFYAKEYADDYPEPEAIVTAKLSNAVIKEVPVVMEERIGGKSSINSVKSVYYMFKVSLSILFSRMIFSGGNNR